MQEFPSQSTVDSSHAEDAGDRDDGRADRNRESTKTSDCSPATGDYDSEDTTGDSKSSATAISKPSRCRTLMPRRESPQQKQHGSVDRGDVIVYELVGASATVARHHKAESCEEVC